ncbi:MAG: hypothetical protein IKI64_07500 [Clostridia bacterium]|nr:hypothetical protein [Clostridia bacterium]
MQDYFVFTNEYEANIVKLIKRRLAEQETDASKELIGRIGCMERGESGSCPSADQAKSCAVIAADGETELDALSLALIRVLLIDLRYFELADMIAPLDESHETKRRILERALDMTKEPRIPGCAAEALKSYLYESGSLNLEGYLRFRLRDGIEFFRAAFDSAYAEEYEAELMNDLFSLFGLPFVSASTQNGEQIGGAVLAVLNPDGSCTLSDAHNAYERKDGGGAGTEHFRIECAPGSIDGVLILLRSLAPSCVRLVDLSLGKCDELRRAIEELFLQCGKD